MQPDHQRNIRGGDELSPSPLVCPRGPHGHGPDCALWNARERIALRRSIEAASASRASISALVLAESNRDFRCPDSLPTRPIPVVHQVPTLPESNPQPVADTQKGVLQDA